MKPEFKMIIFIGIGVSLLLVGLYYNQFNTLMDFVKQLSAGGTYGIPT